VSSSLSIIYVNYFCSSEIHQSISSFREKIPDVDIYVTDNSGDYVVARDETVFRPDLNIGYLNGFITMAGMTKSRLVCLCNPDIELDIIDISSILKYAEPAVLAPIVLDEAGRDQNPYKTRLPSRFVMVLNFSMLLVEWLCVRLFGIRNLRSKILRDAVGEHTGENLGNIIPHGAFIMFKDCEFTGLYSRGNNLYFEEERIAFWAEKKCYTLIQTDKCVVKHSQASPSTGALNESNKLWIKLKSLLELMYS
jgi:hypothetical protein